MFERIFVFYFCFAFLTGASVRSAKAQNFYEPIGGADAHSQNHNNLDIPGMTRPNERSSAEVAKSARFVMAALYQSCDVLNLAPMPSTETTRGIRVGPNHSDGVGRVRTIGSVGNVLESHYYMANVTRVEPLCRAGDIPDLTRRPPIYNYGGKPSFGEDSFSMQEPAGSGASNVAGIDCSGFVVAALARAGLSLSPNETRSWHEIATTATPSTSFTNGSHSCLETVKFNSKSEPAIKAGDILGWRGHVVMIDSVGEDPFGFNANENLKTKSDCVSNVSFSDLNFRIIQSSPEGGSVGVNIMDAGDYFASADIAPMKELLIQACGAHFDKNQEFDASATGIALTRHLSEKSECQTRKIAVDNEECVSSCRNI